MKALFSSCCFSVKLKKSHCLQHVWQCHSSVSVFNSCSSTLWRHMFPHVLKRETLSSFLSNDCVALLVEQILKHLKLTEGGRGKSCSSAHKVFQAHQTQRQTRQWSCKTERCLWKLMRVFRGRGFNPGRNVSTTKLWTIWLMSMQPKEELEVSAAANRRQADKKRNHSFSSA